MFFNLHLGFTFQIYKKDDYSKPNRKKESKKDLFFEPIQAAAGLTKTFCNMPRRIGMARNRKWKSTDPTVISMKAK